ncbi:hypothetical protein JST97_27150 [bacterium]|nr:hypothetical protein [bacterium]
MLGMETAQELERRLKDELELARRTLPARRSRFKSGEPGADQYFECLQRLAQHLRESQQLEQSARVSGEWARASGSAAALLEYGGALQLLGREREAQVQYLKVHRRDHRRHYHLAALAWQMGQPEQALGHLLQGMLLWRAVTRALLCREQGAAEPDCGAYWDQYGHLWSAGARSFLVAVANQGVVKLGIREAFEDNLPLSQILPGRVRSRVLGRVLNRAGTCPPQRQPERTTT